jgi:hypothetical protein
MKKYLSKDKQRPKELKLNLTLIEWKNYPPKVDRWNLLSNQHSCQLLSNHYVLNHPSVMDAQLLKRSTYVQLMKRINSFLLIYR